MKPSVVPPVDPCGGRQLDVDGGAPGSLSVDELRFEEAVDGLGKGVVITVPTRTNRGHSPGLGEALGVADREVLHAPVAVVDEGGEVIAAAVPDRPLPSVEGGGGAEGGGDPPPPREAAVDGPDDRPHKQDPPRRPR